MNESETRISDRRAKPAAAAKKGGFTLSLKGRALRLLSAREQSRAKLERKLGSHEEEPGQLAAVLNELEAKGVYRPQPSQKYIRCVWVNAQSTLRYHY